MHSEIVGVQTSDIESAVVRILMCEGHPLSDGGFCFFCVCGFGLLENAFYSRPLFDTSETRET